VPVLETDETDEPLTAVEVEELADAVLGPPSATQSATQLLSDTHSTTSPHC